MPQTVDDLILDLLEWIGPGERPYAETMEAWRTSCPRLPVWEDALESGFVVCERRPASLVVSLTMAGRTFLESERPAR